MKKNVNENCYIRSLKLGFNNADGISMKDVVEQLNIDLEKDIAFKITYTKWFFENFETKISSNFPTFRFKYDNINAMIESLGKHKAFLKGDALNKYIDYLELERTRKASRTAVWVSVISILLAIGAIITPIVVDRTPHPPFDVKVINPTDLTDTIIINKVQDSAITSKSN